MPRSLPICLPLQAQQLLLRQRWPKGLFENEDGSVHFPFLHPHSFHHSQRSQLKTSKQESRLYFKRYYP